jgi:hypothetical protein
MIVKPKIFRDTGTYKVRFLYLAVENGVLVNKIIERYVNAGETVIAPAIASSLVATSKKSCGLTFSAWNYTDLTNIHRDLDVGAIYNPTDNKTHAFVSVTAGTGLTLYLYYNKSDGSTLNISWGDGSADYTSTSSGNLNTTHTYSTVGTYEITMWISSGTGTYSFGNGTSLTTFIGGDTLSRRQALTSIFIGNNVVILSDHCFNGNGDVNFATINNTVTSLGISAFQVNKFESLSIPSSVTSIGNYAFRYCRKLTRVSLPNTIASLGIGTFDNNYSLESICIPDSITTLQDNILNSCYSLTSVVMGSNVTTIGGSFGDCYSLNSINLPSGITSLGTYVFGFSQIRNLTLPSTLTSIGASAFNSCESLEHLIIPEGVDKIQQATFSGTFSLKTLTLKRYTAPSTITTLDNTNAFNYINAQLRIYVPVGSETVYKTATNWSTYANYIYEDNATNRALFGD